MGTTGSLVFTGISSYSDDFQTILQRAVSIAQLPVKSLQNQQTDNLDKKQALVAMNPAVASLASAITALGTIASNQAVVASSSDTSIVSVVSAGASSPVSYGISNIQSLATAASETSVQGYEDSKTDPVSISGNVDLVLGFDTYHLDISSNNSLAGLRDAINNSGAGVTAAILTAPGGNYLSVSANTLGATTLQLNDVPLAMVTASGTGTETSLTSLPDQDTTAVSRDGQVRLTVGSNTYDLDLSGDNTLDGLRDAINNAGAGVTATVVADGSGYSLSIAADDGLPVAISLDDIPDTPNLITASNQGSDTDFYLNGNIHVVKQTNVINDVIPGLSFTLRDTTAGSVTLALSTDSSQLASALQAFAGSYNAVADQVAQQVGTSAGALQGDMLIQQISSDMQQVASYWNGSGSIRSLADLGLTFDTTGHITFDQSTFAGLSSGQISDAFHFIGSSKTGLAALAGSFSQLSDPLTGFIRIQEDGYDTANDQLTSRIADLNDRVSAVQASMSAKLQAADALLASLQSQQNTLTASIQSINYVTYGKNPSSSS